MLKKSDKIFYIYDLVKNLYAYLNVHHLTALQKFTAIVAPPRVVLQ